MNRDGAMGEGASGLRRRGKRARNLCSGTFCGDYLGHAMCKVMQAKWCQRVRSGG